MKTRKPKYIVRYGMSGVEKCYSLRQLADFIHNLTLSGPQTISVEKVEKDNQ